MKRIIPPQKYRRQNQAFKARESTRADDTDGVIEGRIEKRPSVKLRKEKQKKKKKHLSVKTNNMRKDVIQIKKEH